MAVLLWGTGRGNFFFLEKLNTCTYACSYVQGVVQIHVEISR